MKLEDTLYKAPEMSEEKFMEQIQKIINLQQIPGSNLYSLFRDKSWTPEELIEEWQLIQNKVSKLSRFKRDAVSMIVSAALINMVNDEESK